MRCPSAVPGDLLQGRQSSCHRATPTPPQRRSAQASCWQTRLVALVGRLAPLGSLFPAGGSAGPSAAEQRYPGPLEGPVEPVIPPLHADSAGPSVSQNTGGCEWFMRP